MVRRPPLVQWWCWDWCWLTCVGRRWVPGCSAGAAWFVLVGGWSGLVWCCLSALAVLGVYSGRCLLAVGVGPRVRSGRCRSSGSLGSVSTRQAAGEQTETDRDRQTEHRAEREREREREAAVQGREKEGRKNVDTHLCCRAQSFTVCICICCRSYLVDPASNDMLVLKIKPC